MFVNGSTAIAGTVWERQSRARLLADFVRRSNDRMRQIAGIWQRANGTDETQALARDCADELLLRAAVPDRLWAALMRLLSVELETIGRPNRSNELVFTDDAITVLYQVNQKVKSLAPRQEHRKRGAVHADRYRVYDPRSNIALADPQWKGYPLLMNNQARLQKIKRTAKSFAHGCGMLRPSRTGEGDDNGRRRAKHHQTCR